jgi:hypothetical protein
MDGAGPYPEPQPRTDQEFGPAIVPSRNCVESWCPNPNNHVAGCERFVWLVVSSSPLRVALSTWDPACFEVDPFVQQFIKAHSNIDIRGQSYQLDETHRADC